MQLSMCNLPSHTQDLDDGSITLAFLPKTNLQYPLFVFRFVVFFKQLRYGTPEEPTISHSTTNMALQFLEDLRRFTKDSRGRRS